eukprot:PITA_01245
MVAGYAHNGKVDEALKLFREIPGRNTVSLSAMISVYLQNGCTVEALKIFQQMQMEGTVPESKTLACVLSAHHVFDKMHQRDVVSGYAQNGQGEEALRLFQEMQPSCVKPNSKTFATLLSACANLAALEHGMEIHEKIIISGLQFDLLATSALIDMYAKCSRLTWACHLFERMQQRDTAIIAGHAQNVLAFEALKIFQEMQLAGVKPNAKTFAGVLPTYANLAALDQGKEIHQAIIKRGLHSNVFVPNGLIDMYAKCGSIGKAHDLFDSLPQRNVVSWTTMIAGYAMHSYGKEALKLFEEMKHSGMAPSHITLLCVLSACRHAGLVDEGRRYFSCMNECYNIKPSLEHYNCMVDLLGRAGYFEEAQDFISKMPIKPDVNVWRCLLSACRIHNNVELGEQYLFELESKNAAHYTLLSNIYTAAGRWGDIERYEK